MSTRYCTGCTTRPHWQAAPTPCCRHWRSPPPTTSCSAPTGPPPQKPLWSETSPTSPASTASPPSSYEVWSETTRCDCSPGSPGEGADAAEQIRQTEGGH